MIYILNLFLCIYVYTQFPRLYNIHIFIKDLFAKLSYNFKLPLNQTRQFLKEGWAIICTDYDVRFASTL